MALDTGKHIRVLVVDDDEDDFIIVRDLLRETDGRGFAVEWRSGFAEGEMSIRLRAHDAYLIDHRLGSKNGLDLLRSATAAGCQAPIIIMIAQGEFEAGILAMKLGASDYLVKGKINKTSLSQSILFAVETRSGTATSTGTVDDTVFRAFLSDIIRAEIQMMGAAKALPLARGVEGLSCAEDGTVSRVARSQGAVLGELAQRFFAVSQFARVPIRMRLLPFLNAHPNFAMPPQLREWHAES